MILGISRMPPSFSKDEISCMLAVKLARLQVTGGGGVLPSQEGHQAVAGDAAAEAVTTCKRSGAARRGRKMWEQEGLLYGASAKQQHPGSFLPWQTHFGTITNTCVSLQTTFGSLSTLGLLRGQNFKSCHFSPALRRLPCRIT